MTNSVQLGEVTVGKNHPPYIVAEIGSNHNGDMALCRQLIDAAADAGAHAVKFQSWTETSLIAEEEYARNTQYSDKKRHFGSLREMVRAYQFTADAARRSPIPLRVDGESPSARRRFRRQRLICSKSSTCRSSRSRRWTSCTSALLKYVARKQRPVIISTGMATLAEIEQAVEAVRAERQRPDRAAALRLDLSSGLRHDQSAEHGDLCSRRSMCRWGSATTHLGLPSRWLRSRLAPVSSRNTSRSIRTWRAGTMPSLPTRRNCGPSWTEGTNVFQALGRNRRKVSEAELEKRKKFRRSLVARHELRAGHMLTERDFDAKRPGTGIAPNELPYVVGRRLVRDVRRRPGAAWNDLAMNLEIRLDSATRHRGRGRSRQGADWTHFCCTRRQFSASSI